MVNEKSKLESDLAWARSQIEAFRAVRPRYIRMAETLQRVLELAARKADPLAIVQARPKSIASFAEKIQRKKNKYRDPLSRMTDLCGARVVTQTQSEEQAVCEFIKSHFEIDEANSLDVSSRLRPSEFGYRSIHYIVRFRPGVFPESEIAHDLYPDPETPMKAEIQVRTILEHAWSAFTHDRIYKGPFAIPSKWERELAIQAGMLEEVDQAFNRVQAGLQTYMASYGAYLTKAQLLEEIELLKLVHESDPNDVKNADRLGKLLMELGSWQEAADLMAPFAGAGYPPLLRDLGVALCKIHAGEPSRPEYQQGQKYLEGAIAPPSRDVDALASLAGTWKSVNPEKARAYYRRAFELDPTDPYAVSNFLVFEIARRKDPGAAALMAPSIDAAIRRCRDQIEVGMNAPWTFYNLGMFYLLQDRPYESLNAYAKAVQLSSDDWMIETSLRLLDQLAGSDGSLRGMDWARKLLVLGWRVKFPGENAVSQFKKLPFVKTDAGGNPILILAGGTARESDPQVESFLAILEKGFQEFQGLILSGGTRAGISAFAGNLQEKNPHSMRAVGYIPKTLPAGAAVDPRYGQIRRTDGGDFSALEPLQMWIDLTASGIPPQSVRLIGVNGGWISAFEYRLALALGASIGILAGSGREADALLADPDWASAGGLLALPADSMTVRAFVAGDASPLEAPAREAVAQAIHEAYREKRHRTISDQDPACADWDCLSDAFKASNLSQADDIRRKLKRIGCSMAPVSGVKGKPVDFSASEIETLAELEHGRWVVERLRDGWKFAAERDAGKKTSPFLIPWSELPDEVREYDKETVRKTPEFLAKAGMAIIRIK
jgi:ppGpp synthetase/RelA/SpoT-type nucleotidyltranferase